MTTRLKHGFGLTAGILVLLGSLFWIITHPRNHDPYAFLNGRTLQDVVVVGPGSWPASELRLYSWREPFKSVISKAGPELEKLGLKREKKGKNAGEGETWTTAIIDGGMCGTSAELQVVIRSGNNPNLSKMMKVEDKDPEWTTVEVVNFLDESWITVLRYTFFGFRY